MKSSRQRPKIQEKVFSYFNFTAHENQPKRKFMMLAGQNLQAFL
jgi:hypothetical protein